MAFSNNFLASYFNTNSTALAACKQHPKKRLMGWLIFLFHAQADWGCAIESPKLKASKDYLN
jgi:hypothetical protein